MSASMFNSPTSANPWRGTGHFPDPFCDMASMAMPQTIREANFWTEFILLANGPYREAISRVVSYFLTQIEIHSESQNRLGREEKQKYEDFLQKMGIMKILRDVALDYLTYGNAFISVIVPFRRFLMCGNENCRLELPLRHVYSNREFGFQWRSFEFVARCPHCGYHGAWRHIDRRIPEKLHIHRWNPHEMDIVHETVSEESEYIWRITDMYRSQIRRGTLHHLERAPWEVIEAVRDNMSLQFDSSEIFHLREATFAGVRHNGWGISRVLTNFRQAWYFQVLQRFNEAIALDHIVPFRCLTPMPRPGSGGGDVNDPVLTINMGDWRSQVERMIRDHQMDPARWNILNYPIQYQSLGGDATQLAPKDLIEQALATLLNAAGIPVELYNASLTTQAAPTALRLFEANWSHLTYHLNEVIRFIVDKIGRLMNWEPVTARLKRVTHADDLNRQMAQLQLMMGGQISRTTGLATVGANFEEEERRKIEEEQISAELVGDAQKEMEQSAMMQGLVQQGGGQSPAAMPPGGQPGMPPPPGPMGQPTGPAGPAQAFTASQGIMPRKPQTVEEWEQMAETIVGMLMPRSDSERRSMLVKLKQEDKTMHALVTSRLNEVRRDAAAQGQDMVLAQQYGKQAAAVLPATSGYRSYRRRSRPLDLSF